MPNQLFKITQNLIIQDPEKGILILKHKTGKWLLPGGKIQENESWLEALKREIKEETGITQFEIKKILDIDSWTEDKTGYYLITFLAEISEKREIEIGPSIQTAICLKPFLYLFFCNFIIGSIIPSIISLDIFYYIFLSNLHHSYSYQNSFKISYTPLYPL